MISRRSPFSFALSAGLLALVGCPDSGPASQTPTNGGGSGKTPTASVDPKVKELAERAKLTFGVLPTEAESATNEVTDEKVALGRSLYFDTRLSKGQGISCNTCHDLAKFGVDGEPTSPGHKGQRGDRNSPTVYNSALQFVQFWDGRAATVEDQATMPITNPVEMAMTDADTVIKVVKSVPGYEPMFKAAFPDESGELITMENVGKAIGAFERRLMTPSRFDEFMGGKHDALNEQEVRGLATYLEVNCQMCHLGPLLGGNMYQKLGLVKPVETADPGRAKHTGQESDKGFWKVPMLRNVTKTGPYYHDGSIKTLEEAVKHMADVQLGKTLTDSQVADIVAFLGALEGKLPGDDLIGKPEMPPNGPDTPAPDPN